MLYLGVSYNRGHAKSGWFPFRFPLDTTPKGCQLRESEDVERQRKLLEEQLVAESKLVEQMRAERDSLAMLGVHGPQAVDL